VEAIRSATADLLLGNEPVEITITIWRYGTAKRIQVHALAECACAGTRAVSVCAG